MAYSVAAEERMVIVYVLFILVTLLGVTQAHQARAREMRLADESALSKEKIRAASDRLIWAWLAVATAVFFPLIIWGTVNYFG